MRNILKLCNDSEREERNGAKTWKSQLWILTRKKCALAMCIKNLPTFFSFFIDDDNNTHDTVNFAKFLYIYLFYILVIDCRCCCLSSAFHQRLFDFFPSYTQKNNCWLIFAPFAIQYWTFEFISVSCEELETRFSLIFCATFARLVDRERLRNSPWVLQRFFMVAAECQIKKFLPHSFYVNSNDLFYWNLTERL